MGSRFGLDIFIFSSRSSLHPFTILLGGLFLWMHQWALSTSWFLVDSANKRLEGGRRVKLGYLFCGSFPAESPCAGCKPLLKPQLLSSGDVLQQLSPDLGVYPSLCPYRAWNGTRSPLRSLHSLLAFLNPTHTI